MCMYCGTRSHENEGMRLAFCSGVDSADWAVLTKTTERVRLTAKAVARIMLFFIWFVTVGFSWGHCRGIDHNRKPG